MTVEKKNFKKISDVAQNVHTPHIIAISSTLYAYWETSCYANNRISLEEKWNWKRFLVVTNTRTPNACYSWTRCCCHAVFENKQYHKILNIMRYHIPSKVVFVKVNFLCFKSIFFKFNFFPFNFVLNVLRDDCVIWNQTAHFLTAQNFQNCKNLKFLSSISAIFSPKIFNHFDLNSRMKKNYLKKYIYVGSKVYYYFT